jgi:hypothetical protein
MNEPVQNYSLAHHMPLFKFLTNLGHYKLMEDDTILKPCLKSGSSIHSYAGQHAMVKDMLANMLECNYL